MQLTVNTIFERSEKYFRKNHIVSRNAFGETERYNYEDFGDNVRRLSSFLLNLNLEKGARIGVLCWNNRNYFELYAAVPCVGFQLHTINLRLSSEQVCYIINHAKDEVIFVTSDMLPVIENIRDRIPCVKHFVVIGDLPSATSLRPAYDYDEVLAQSTSLVDFPSVDESAPSGICYTSATTGDPKGVQYSHRGTYLHAMVLAAADTMGISEHDRILPVVPMFHVNAWGLPYAGMFMGSEFILPGVRPTTECLLDLIDAEMPTIVAASVTVGVDMLKQLRHKPRRMSSLRLLMLGGQATPLAVVREFEDEYGVPVFTAWGATETAPIATTLHFKRSHLGLTDMEKSNVSVRQGLPAPGVVLKVVNDKGDEVLANDIETGEIFVRGPWVATEYYQNPSKTLDGFTSDGFWRSGDIATVDPEGVLKLVDRKKDLIKSGGEWISSIDIENILMSFPEVVEAAVVAKPDPKWIERPVAFLTTREKVGDQHALTTGLNTLLLAQFPKWWLPDDYHILEEMPKTGVGKTDKRRLRELVLENKILEVENN